MLLTLRGALQPAVADCANAPAELVSWWPGDGFAADIAGTNSGVLQGTATASAEGVVGTAFGFDGANGFVQVPDSTSLRPTNLTIEGWVQFASQDSAGSGGSPAGDQYIVFKQNSRSTDFEGFDLSKTRMGGSNVFRFVVSSAAGQAILIRSSTVINTGMWYHVAGVRGPDFIQLYVNGALERQTNVSFAQDYGSQPLYFSTSGQSYWDHKLAGRLDEVSLYDRALEPGEIAAIYAAGAAGKCKAPDITLQPQSQAVRIGSNVTFSGAATGLGTLSYQWRFNSSPIAGATTTSLTLVDVQPSAAGNYSVVVSNALGTATSSNAVLTVLPPPCAPAPPGLVGWWRAEGNGIDFAGGNTAVLVNGVGFTKGMVGQAFDFNGIDGRVTVADAPALDVSTNDFSIEAWIRPLPSITDFGIMTIVCKRVAPDIFHSLGYEFALGNGQLQLRISTSLAGDGEVWGPAGPDLRDGQFHHVAMSVARNSPTGGCFYVDGQVVLTFDPTGQAGSLSIPEPLRIGNHATSWFNGFFKGQIDEVSLYARALAASEVQDIYGAERSGKCAVPIAPTILVQPTNQVATVGDGLRFDVLAVGTEPLAYQWQVNSTNLAGATASSLVLTNVQLQDAGGYTALITNLGGTALSSNAVLTVLPPPPCATAPPGLVSWWPAEGSAVDVADGNAGALYNGATFGPGRGGQAFKFNGTSSYVEVPDSPSLRLTNELTIEFWVKRQTLNPITAEYIIEKGGDWLNGTQNYAVAIHLPSYNHLLHFTCSGAWWGAGGIADLNWHHCAVAARNGQPAPEIYIDGVRQTLAYHQGGNINLRPSTRPLHLGAQVDPVSGWNYYSKSLIDELSLYDRALTEGEIQAIYNAERSGKCPLPPRVVSQPVAQVAAIGANASFHAAAGGTPPLAYRWQKDGLDLADGGKLSGATTDTLTITGVQPGDEGTYRLTATNELGGAVGAGAPLTVVPVLTWGATSSAPAATSNAVQIASGQWHQTALRSDGRPVAWGWDSNGQSTVPESATNVIALAAGFEHTLGLRMDGTLVSWGRPELATVPAGATNIVAIAAGNYHSLALREDGTVLAWAYDNYYGPASVPAAATNVVALAGGGYWSLALKADGTVLPWGDWRYGSLDVPSDLSNVVAIAAGFDIGLARRSDATLVGWGVDFHEPPTGPGALSNVVTMACGSFHTLVLYPDETVYAWGRNNNGECNVPSYATNVLAIGGGDFSSMALLRDARTQLGPSVWVRSDTRFVGAGGAVTLRSRAAGSLPLSFQWLFNSEPLAGQTNRWLALANMATNRSGDYQLVVTNPYGAATSAVSSVTVLLPPTVAVAPTNAAWIVGGSGTLVSQAAGTEPLQFQWFRGSTQLTDDARLSGTTSNILSVSSVLTSDAGTYTVVVTDPAGSMATATSVVSVVVAPAFTAQPQGWSVPVGLPVQLSGIASGTAPLNYQWRLNGVDVPGATSNVLSFAALSPEDFGNYQLVVTNLWGAATSAVAQLTKGPVAIWGVYSFAANAPTWPAPGLSNVIAVAAGSAYSLALREDGTVYAWGINASATNLPPGLSGIVGIAAGRNHALALRSNGTVVAWGYNSSGQTNVPVGLSNVVAVTAGSYHSAALRADGTVVVWGGDPREGQMNIPPGLIKVIAIDAGGSQALALRDNGTVVGWGGSIQTPVPPYLHGVSGVAAGFSFNSLSLALLTDGSLVAWNGAGLTTNVPPGLTNLVAVAVAGSTDRPAGPIAGVSLVLRSNGTVTAWGSPTGGITNVPPGLSNAVAIAGGTTHALALMNDGKPLIVRPPVGGTFYWGGDPVLKAKAVGNAPLSLQWYKDSNPLVGETNETLMLPSAQATDAGSYYLVASNALGVARSLAVPVTIGQSPPVFRSQPAGGLAFWGSPWSLGASVIGSGPVELTWLQSGSPVATGTDGLYFDSGLPEHTGLYYLVASNSFGRVNSDPAQTIFSRVASWGNGPNPTNAPFNVGTALAVASGYFHALAIQSDRTIIGWGNPSHGATIPPPGLSNVVAVSGGNYFSVALRSDGTVAAWGLGTSGQTNVPPGLSNVVAISAGASHTLALRADGTVAAWGSASSFGTNVPAGLSNVVAVAAGNAHSMALRNDGSVVLWGAYGKPPAYTNVVAISAGYNQCLVLQADGSVINWSTTGATIPQPANLSNVVAISAGGGWQGDLHSVALRADGTLVAWGNNNYYGQLMVPPDLVSATAVSAGGGSTLAYLNDRSPAFTVQPWNRIVGSSTNVTLRALTVGQPTMRYQWYANGRVLPGATNDAVTFTNTQPAQSGVYQLVAMNDLGAATSVVATLTVTVPPVRLTPIGIAADGFRFSFTSLPAVLYIVEFKDSLAGSAWAELERRFGIGGLEIVTDTSVGGATRFYRVRALYAPPPRAASMTWSDGAVGFSFATVPGAVYVIQYRERLEDAGWLELFRQTGTGAPIVVSDPNPAGPSRFYRVQVE